MCLLVIFPIKKVAKRPITVYKRMTVQSDDRLVTPYRCALMYMHAVEKLLPNEKLQCRNNEVHHGLHSYRRESAALKLRNPRWEVIIRGTIPIGAEYYSGFYFDGLSPVRGYASSHLILEEVIHTRNGFSVEDHNNFNTHLPPRDYFTLTESMK